MRAAKQVSRFAAVVAALAMTAACTGGPKPVGPLVVAPATCEDFRISIYFDAGSARLTREAADLLRLSARRAKACTVSGVDVVGLADTPGDPAANLQLSQQRADVVTRLLARHGFSAVNFQVGAAGDAGAETGSGQARPLRRRADVMFHASPKPAGP